MLVLVLAVVALPLGGCEESSYCGVPVLQFLFCDPEDGVPPVFETNDPPVASFSVDPDAPRVGATVTFSNTSRDPDGLLPGLMSLGRSVWDLDGDGGFETHSEPSWTGRGFLDEVTRAYDTAGPRTVRLRVVDWEGASSEASRQIVVGGPPRRRPGDPPGAVVALARSDPPHGFLARLTFDDLSARGARRRGRSLRGVRVRGRITGRVNRAVTTTGEALPRAPRALSRLLASRLAARVDVVANRARTRQVITAIGLATFRGRRPGAVCFQLRLINRTGRQPRGGLRILGGTGAGARVRGSGRMRGELRSKKLAMIGGTIRTRAARTTRLPAGCRALSGRG